MRNDTIENTFGGLIQVTKSETGNPVVYTLYSKKGFNLTSLKFQDGAPCNTHGPNGFTVEDLLDVAIHRIKHLDSCLPSEYNAKAINALKEAHKALTDRFKERN